MPFGVLMSAFLSGVYLRVELLGHGRGNLNAKVSLPSVSSLLSRISLLRELLEAFKCMIFYILCSFSSLSQEDDLPATSYSLIQEAKNVLLIHFNNLLICIYLISYLDYSCEHSYID